MSDRCTGASSVLRDPKATLDQPVQQGRRAQLVLDSRTGDTGPARTCVVDYYLERGFLLPTGLFVGERGGFSLAVMELPDLFPHEQAAASHMFTFPGDSELTVRLIAQPRNNFGCADTVLLYDIHLTAVAASPVNSEAASTNP